MTRPFRVHVWTKGSAEQEENQAAAAIRRGHRSTEEKWGEHNTEEN